MAGYYPRELLNRNLLIMIIVLITGLIADIIKNRLSGYSVMITLRFGRNEIELLIEG